MIERIKESIRERLIRPYVIINYGRTLNGRKLKKLHDTYSGQRCFFIGNGPSLSADDLTVLHRNKEITFAFNRIYNIFDQTEWRPTFYISQDEKILKGCSEMVNTLNLPAKFVPIQFRWYHGIDIEGAIYFNMNWKQKELAEEFVFSESIEKEIASADTGMYTAAQMAVYMGFKEIYFIGVDHHFHISQNNKGEIVIDNTVKDYFTDKYNEDKENLYIPNTERSTRTYIAIKRHCDRLGVSVCNATRGGKLEVFPRVEFDSLFKGEKGALNGKGSEISYPHNCTT